MIKRIIEISQQPMHLSVRLQQLVLQPSDLQKTQAKTIPCEDIGLLVLDHPQITITQPALAALVAHGAAVMVCAKNHLPAGLLVPLSEHTQVVWRLQDQIRATQPTIKRLWQQIISAKIRAQARNLPMQSPLGRTLEQMSKQVKSGDTTNLEAQAARLYWSAWLLPDGTPPLVSSTLAQSGGIDFPMIDQPDLPSSFFSRNQDGLDPLNIHLNYGYAVLRASVARALICAGLFPSLGIHHRHRANTFALADDLMEPLRPLIDHRVRRLYQSGRLVEGLTQPNKAYLLDVLNQNLRCGEDTGPLMVSLHRYTASLHRCLCNQEEFLMIPVQVEE